MSSEINQGLNTERPSSRVLKPPGGVSNIFAEPEQAQLRPRPKYNQQNSSSLNACMNTVDPNEKIAVVTEPAQKRNESLPKEPAIVKPAIVKPAPVQNGSSNGPAVAAVVPAVSSVAPVVSTVGNNNASKSVETINSAPAAAAQSGGRVRVPPGGFSSALW